MRKLSLFAILFSLTLISPISAFAAPYRSMQISFANMGSPDALTKMERINPLYIFNNPFWENRIISWSDLKKIHARLPDTKVILHLTCCSIFNPSELDSPIAKINFSTQNTQMDFNSAWNNHQDAFMKNAKGDYVYHRVEKNGEMWINEGDGFLMDPANEYYQDLLYNRIKQHIVGRGFDGVYLDVMYPVFMSPFYFSRPAENGQVLDQVTWQSKLVSLSTYIVNRQQQDPDPVMQKALIITNSVGGGPGDTEDPIDRVAFNRDLKTKGVQIENPFHNYKEANVESWLNTISRIREITALRNGQMAGWLNYHHSDRMKNTAECESHALFAYASYLLANESPNFAFYFQCKIVAGQKVNQVEPSETLTQIRLGKDQGQYSKTNSLYLRSFENGLVLVNPTNRAHSYTSPLDLKNAYGSTLYPTGKQFAVPAHSGLVLISADKTPPVDFNQDGKVTKEDHAALISEFGKPYTIFDYNKLVRALKK